jgi:isopentenyl diphosphate isomerase/L-lactate dehydrogenase-like FMN-dependent dehydrogenase
MGTDWVGILVMREEIELGMQLLGVTRLEELTAKRVRFVDRMRRSRL